MRLSAVSISKSQGDSRQAVDKAIKRGRIDTWVSEIVITSATQVRKTITILIEMACARMFLAMRQAGASCCLAAQEP
jgi:hypothetical protein